MRDEKMRNEETRDEKMHDEEMRNKKMHSMSHERMRDEKMAGHLGIGMNLFSKLSGRNPRRNLNLG